MVMLYINVRSETYISMQANILHSQTLSTPGMGKQILCPKAYRLKGQNNFFWKWSCCISKKKRFFFKPTNFVSNKFNITHTPYFLGWIKRSDIEIVQISIFLLNKAC